MTADTAVIARSDRYPDGALAGAPLATNRNAPMLLTAPDSLSEATRAELARLGVTNIVLLGGDLGAVAHAPAWNHGRAETVIGKRRRRAFCPLLSLPTSSCPCLCARRNGRRAWPSARPPARPAWRPLLPSPRDPGGFRRGGLGLETLLFGLCRFLGLSRLGAGGGLGFALGLTALHLGIVGSRLGAKLVQDVLSRLHRSLLAVREVRFLEFTHRRGLVAFTLGGWTHAARGMAPW